jgi:hypothetical protein
MVDKTNPMSQFHPYTPADAIPQSEQAQSGLKSMLGRAGIDPDNLGAVGDRLRNMNWGGSVEKARGWARSKPGVALGALAVAAIGAGLMRGRSS